MGRAAKAAPYRDAIDRRAAMPASRRSSPTSPIAACDLAHAVVHAQDVAAAAGVGRRAGSADPVRQPVVVGRDQAAIAGRDVVRRVQPCRAVAEAPDPPAAERRPVGRPGVLDDGQPVPVGDRADHVHVGRQPVAGGPGRSPASAAVIAASIRFASMRNVSGSMSTNTGVAPVERGSR